MCLNRQVDSIRITLHRRNLHRIENGLVRFSVNRVLDHADPSLIIIRWRKKSGADTIKIKNEPPRGKTNNVVFEQVRHKPSCTSTEAG